MRNTIPFPLRRGTTGSVGCIACRRLPDAARPYARARFARYVRGADLHPPSRCRIRR
jgi:hypothetical protein